MATQLHGGPVYGPVRSRRLGLSLGVNLSPVGGKRCNFDCAYCECGLNEERRTSEGFPARPEVARGLEAELRALAEAGERLDVITFAGNGEPTMHPDFAGVIDDTLALRARLAPAAKVAVLSNGTLCDRPAVHDALLRVDDNILKLDTVDPAFVRLVDRPVGRYDLAERVRAFSSFNGHCMIQTMFLRGSVGGTDVCNTSERFVAPWLDALARIRPASVMIYTVARDTPVTTLAKAPADDLDAIAEHVRGLGIPCTVSY